MKNKIIKIFLKFTRHKQKKPLIKNIDLFLSTVFFFFLAIVVVLILIIQARVRGCKLAVTGITSTLYYTWDKYSVK